MPVLLGYIAYFNFVKHTTTYFF